MIFIVLNNIVQEYSKNICPMQWCEYFNRQSRVIELWVLELPWEVATLLADSPSAKNEPRRAPSRITPPPRPSVMPSGIYPGLQLHCYFGARWPLHCLWAMVLCGSMLICQNMLTGSNSISGLVKAACRDVLIFKRLYSIYMWQRCIFGCGVGWPCSASPHRNPCARRRRILCTLTSVNVMGAFESLQQWIFGFNIRYLVFGIWL